MKRCPKCQAEYPDDANWCRIDGGRLQLVQAAPSRAPQPGALTMGWDVQPEVTAAATTPAMHAQKPASQPGSAHLPQTPGALTMGWDVPEEAMQEAVSPTALAAKSIATTHAPVAKSPAATLLGMQAPWTQQPPPAPAPIPLEAPSPGMTQAYGAQAPLDDAQAAAPSPPSFAPSPEPPIADPPHSPPMSAPSPALQPPRGPAVEVASSTRHAGASRAETTLRTRASADDLDKPPKNKLPLYALLAVLVIAASIAAVVLATR